MPNVWPMWVGQQQTTNIIINNTWQTWNSTEPITITASTIPYQVQIWNNWVQTGTTGGGYFVPSIWTGWNTAYNQALIQQLGLVYDRPLTRDQAYAGPLCDRPFTRLQQFEADAEARRKECEWRRRTNLIATRSRASAMRRRIADRKANELLSEQLSAEQLAEWQKDKAFHIVTADGLRRYRIANGMAGNVKLVECKGEQPVGKHGRSIRAGARFCAHVYHPDGWVPNADNVLAQKLLLEADESAFLAMANVSY